MGLTASPHAHAMATSDVMLVSVLLVVVLQCLETGGEEGKDGNITSL